MVSCKTQPILSFLQRKQKEWRPYELVRSTNHHRSACGIRSRVKSTALTPGGDRRVMPVFASAALCVHRGGSQRRWDSRRCGRVFISLACVLNRTRSVRHAYPYAQGSAQGRPPDLADRSYRYPGHQTAEVPQRGTGQAGRKGYLSTSNNDCSRFWRPI